MKPRTKPGFVCTGECDSCPVHTWRLLSAQYHHPEFSLSGCSMALIYSFNCSAITKAEYDQYIEAKKVLYDEDDEKYICPQSTGGTDPKLCADCSVCSYLKFLGFHRTTISARGFYKFKSPEGDDKLCSNLMKSLCGVEVSHDSINTKYNIVNRSDIDLDFIEMMTAEITSRANHLELTISSNIEERKRQLKEKEEINRIQLEEETEKKRLKKLAKEEREQRIQLEKEEKERRRKAEEQLRIVKRQNQYNLIIERLKNLARTEDAMKTSIGEFTDNGFNNLTWIPPAKYTGDPIALANSVRESKKADRYLAKKLAEYPYEEGSPKYIAFRANLITRTQNDFLKNMRNCLYDIYSGKFYYSILEAPVCCRDCNDCELCKVYKQHGHKFKNNRDCQNHCRDLAVKYSNEILEYFNFFPLSELADSPDSGKLKFYDEHQDIVKKLKLYLGRKFIKDPESASKYFDPEG